MRSRLGGPRHQTNSITLPIRFIASNQSINHLEQPRDVLDGALLDRVVDAVADVLHGWAALFWVCAVDSGAGGGRQEETIGRCSCAHVPARWRRWPWGRLRRPRHGRGRSEESPPQLPPRSNDAIRPRLTTAAEGVPTSPDPYAKMSRHCAVVRNAYLSSGWVRSRARAQGRRLL